MPVQGEVTITWSTGLHIRPATLIVQLLQKYQAQVQIIKGGQTCNARSVIQLLTLGASSQEKLTIIATGVDEVQTLEVLKNFFAEYNEPLW